MTPEAEDLNARVRDWFAQRLPAAWLAGPAEIDVDREEVLVVVPLPAESDPGLFRAGTRAERIELAKRAEDAFGLKVSWGTTKGGRRRLYTTVRSPVTVPLVMSERKVLDSLVGAGVAANRGEAVAWCIRLVGHHESDWLRDLRDAAAAAPSGRHDPPVAI